MQTNFRFIIGIWLLFEATSFVAKSKHSISSGYFSLSNPFDDLVAKSPALSTDISELPESFQDAVNRAAKQTLKCVKTTNTFCRIDFDTTIGDQTYTSLKATLPMMKELVCVLTRELELHENDNQSNNTEINEPIKKKSLRVFFPDMGAAALARRDWKIGTDMAEVPACVETANIQNDPVELSDEIVLLLCPQPSEADYVKRVIDLCQINETPCVMINPVLVNMDQGFGVRARNLRNNVLNLFTTTYKLKTMKQGAVVREWPHGYSIWNEDATSDDGYTLLKCFVSDPIREVVDELYDIANPPLEKPAEPGPLGNAAKEILGFFKGLQRL